jgi:hypothetical protein
MRASLIHFLLSLLGDLLGMYNIGDIRGFGFDWSLE